MADSDRQKIAERSQKKKLEDIIKEKDKLIEKYELNKQRLEKHLELSIVCIEESLTNHFCFIFIVTR